MPQHHRQPEDRPNVIVSRAQIRQIMPEPERHQRQQRHGEQRSHRPPAEVGGQHIHHKRQRPNEIDVELARLHIPGHVPHDVRLNEPGQPQHHEVIQHHVRRRKSAKRAAPVVGCQPDQRHHHRRHRIGEYPDNQIGLVRQPILYKHPHQRPPLAPCPIEPRFERLACSDM